MSTMPLQGKRIWLTRPETQNEVLAGVLQARGADVFCLPLLEIVPVAPDADTREQLRNLDRYDLVIYISANAAKAGLEAVARFWPQYPSQPRNFAVGPTTARVLREAGLFVAFPTDRADSEALLALPELQHLQGSRALIVRGVGGRETLAEGLRKRGCKVEYAELYGRCLPAHPRSWLQHALEDQRPDAIVISSAEAMDNLKSLFREWCADWSQLPLYVVSERLEQQAHTAGFSRVARMGGATDTAVLAGLEQAFAGHAA